MDKEWKYPIQNIGDLLLCTCNPLVILMNMSLKFLKWAIILAFGLLVLDAVALAFAVMNGF